MLLVSLDDGVLLLLGGEAEPVGHGSDSEKLLDLLFGISRGDGTALHNDSDHRVKVRKIKASRVELDRQSLTRMINLRAGHRRWRGPLSGPNRPKRSCLL